MSEDNTNLDLDEQHGPAKSSTLRLSLGAVGVVYGDIGTSPLYTIRECFVGEHGTAVSPTNVYGVLSLVFWSLTLVVGLKYLTFVMRADNRGEGGTLALLSQIVADATESKKHTKLLVVLGLFGSALLLAEGMITPAISVLSAVEGLKVATPAFELFIVPITIVILFGLFTVQRFGTHHIARFFGPTMVVWFIMLVLMGIPRILANPAILGAVSPHYGVELFLSSPTVAFGLLASVVLCITGAEALYADMGHFGRGPIRISWFSFVFPALLINYFGQGALMLAAPETQNPFYAMVPSYILYVVIGIATLATIIASQALISGAYSLTQQAVQLGYSPRFNIMHTSSAIVGQIYVPGVNNGLMVACIALVLIFQSSSDLAAAYGLSVMGTMTITSCLFFALARFRWRWPLWKVGPLVALFLAIDIPFFLANLNKFKDGGYVPLVVGGILLIVMLTWYRGRSLIADPVYSASFPIGLFLKDIERTKPIRVQGTAVFMTGRPDVAPSALLHHFKHNQVLHNRVILLSIHTRSVPTVLRRESLEVKELGHGFWSVIAYRGFMQEPDVPRLLSHCEPLGLKIDPMAVSYYLGRVTLLTSGKTRMMKWRKALFSFMYRNERPATSFFNIPPNRVVELGRQLEL